MFSSCICCLGWANRVSGHCEAGGLRCPHRMGYKCSIRASSGWRLCSFLVAMALFCLLWRGGTNSTLSAMEYLGHGALTCVWSDNLTRGRCWESQSPGHPNSRSWEMFIDLWDISFKSEMFRFNLTMSPFNLTLDWKVNIFHRRKGAYYLDFWFWPRLQNDNTNKPQCYW